MGLEWMLADVKTYRCTGSYKHASSVSLLYMFWVDLKDCDAGCTGMLGSTEVEAGKSIP